VLLRFISPPFSTTYNRTPTLSACRKARIAQNARKHGLTAPHLVVREDEREDFESLRNSLLAEFMLQGAVDDFTDPQTCAVLDRLSRYQARAQRSYYRALQELRTLQTNRALRAIKLSAEDEAAVPAITDINELTKQTRSEVMAEALDMAMKMVNYQSESFRLHTFRSPAQQPAL
jgi:hypothetical protein